MSKGYEQIGKYVIYLDQMYYLCYAGGKRELDAKKQKEWDKTLHLPGILKIKEQVKLGMDNNPNVVPLKGSDLMMFIRDLKFVPLFDRAFNSTHLLKMTDLLAYESIKAKSYEKAIQEGYY